MATTQEYQLVLLQPEGRLDLEGAKKLEKQVVGVAPQRHDLWVLDLAQVDFMDSSGLVAVVTALKAARSSGCRLVLCNLQTPVRLIFELTQLDSAFEIFESYDAVLDNVKLNTLAS